MSLPVFVPSSHNYAHMAESDSMPPQFANISEDHQPTRSLSAPAVAEPIRFPSKVDVLCGRGKICFDHVGNSSFRRLIAEHADAYQMAPTKKVKMEVVLLVVEIVTSRGGRFLVRQNDYWIDGSPKQGKRKTGHAFRDALRGRVQWISEMQSAKNAWNNNVNKELRVSEDMSSSNYSSSDGFEFGISDHTAMACEPTPIGNMIVLEPSEEWKIQSLDKETANDLLIIFREDSSNVRSALSFGA